ncbi:MAG: hypothetical protein M1819_007256 [Sarea resinae]|nr:MAG: hypothetical protein M1819_007256 [Sarea resinae]
MTPQSLYQDYAPSPTFENIAILLIALFLLSNIKILPGVWHYRLFKALFTQFILHASSPTATSRTHENTPPSLFRPLVTASHVPLAECDYNLHKSNSTFFTDLDINRTQLLARLFKSVLGKRRPRSRRHGTEGKTTEGNTGSGKVGLALGSVMCTFRRQIRPFQRYDICSRVLTWDDKWLYVVSHFVEKGAIHVTPAFGPGEESVVAADAAAAAAADGDKERARVHVPETAIYSSAIARYVFKEGRITVAPSVVLEEAGFLPSSANSEEETEGTRAEVEGDVRVLERSTCTQVEEERRKGEKFARALAMLGDLPEAFGGESIPPLGRFGDLFW